MNHEQLRRHQQHSGLSLWELGDLLGIHPHLLHVGDASDALLDQPVRILIDLARRLDLHPADLVTALQPLLDHQRREDTITAPSDEPDTRTVLVALATAGTPLTTDQLATALGWTLDRTAAALEYAAGRPELAGPYALRRVAPAGYTLGPRLDVLRPDQRANLADLANHDDPLTEAQAAALLAAIRIGRRPEYEPWRGDHLAVEQQLKNRGLIRTRNGPHRAEVHPDVLFSLRRTTSAPDAGEDP